MPTYEQTEREAKKLWEELGRPEGIDVAIWLATEARLKEREQHLQTEHKTVTKCLKTWGAIFSNWVTVVGVGVGIIAYFQWRASREDRAVDFLFKLDDKFNSPDIIEGRDLVDWDFEYHGITNELEMVIDEKKRQVEDTRRSTLNTNDLAQAKFLDSKIKKLDALLQFYESLNVVRQNKQAPPDWLGTRYGTWLSYYHDKDRTELKHYIDHNYIDLSNWLAKDLLEPTNKRFFDLHHNAEVDTNK